MRPLSNAAAVMQLPALTALRGIAAWLIVLYHFREVMPMQSSTILQQASAKGYLAVDLFFQLSGFVISLNYLEKFRYFDFQEIRHFLMMRIARIYPLHIVILIAFILNPIAIVLFSGHADIGDRYNVNYFILSVLLIQNWGFTSHLAWNIPAWSVSTEFFVYLSFPALAWLTNRFTKGLIPSVILALSLLTLFALVSDNTGIGLGGDIAHYGLIRCVFEFWIGISLFRVCRFRPFRRTWESEMVLLISAGCFLIDYLILAPDGLLVPFGFFMLLYSLSDPRSACARLLSRRYLHYIGTISYSTYLVHYFVKDWVKFLLVRPDTHSNFPFVSYVLLTAAMSAFLYQFVEEPGRHAIRRFIPPRVSIRQTVQ